MPVPIKGMFPNDLEMERIKTFRKYEQLYNNDQYPVFDLHDIIKKQYKDKADILYLAHAVPAKIADFYGDFVQGDSERLQIETSEEKEKETLEKIKEANDLVEEVYNYGLNQSQYGNEFLLGYIKDSEFKIQSFGKDQYFPQRDGSAILATYIRDPLTTEPIIGKRQLFLYTQTYYVDNGSVVIERQIWETDVEGRASEETSFERVAMNVEPREVIQGLDELPIVKITNGRELSNGFGKSDYADIMPQLQEINERSTHVATQLLKNLDHILEVPKVDGTKDENGEWRNIDTLEIPNKDTPRSQYISPESNMLEYAFKHIDRQLHIISWVTGVPMFELTSIGQPERVESMRIKMFNAIRKTETKRSQVSKGLRNIIRIGFKMLKKEAPQGLYIDYSDVIPTDPLKEVQVESEKVTAGISSRKSALKRLENLDDDEADAELKQINEENIRNGAVNPNDAPQI